MAKTVALTIKPAEAIRNGWLAYLGLYGVAYDRARKPVEAIATKATSFFSDLVARGETVEARAEAAIADVRGRAADVYEAGVTRARSVLPEVVTASSRVVELEAEIELLNKKVAALTKKTAPKTAPRATAKSRAKAA